MVLLSFQVSVKAQKISNIRFAQFGRAIEVNYKLEQLSYKTYALLNLYVSVNGGISFLGPLVQVRGDVGKVTSNGDKGIIWYVLDELKQFEGDIIFEVRGDVVKEKLEAENLLMYNVSGSSYAGLMYGRVSRWGGYIRGKTNFSVADGLHTTTDEGQINYEGEGYYTMDKSVKRSRLAITAGVLYRPLQWLYLYAGAGYGFRRLIWHANTYNYDDNQSTGDLWAVNTPHSAEGAEVELGAIFRYKRLGISAGVNTINFTFAEINGALGFFF